MPPRAVAKRARATLRRKRSTPSLLKPSRLIIAWASGRRNIRGFGLPGCGRGVTVPHSMKPKPSVARPSMCAAFLSSPAARPTRLGNVEPHDLDRRRRTRGAASCAMPQAAAASRAGEGGLVRGLGIEREQQGAQQRIEHRLRDGRGERVSTRARMIPSAALTRLYDQPTRSCCDARCERARSLPWGGRCCCVAAACHPDARCLPRKRRRRAMRARRTCKPSSRIWSPPKVSTRRHWRRMFAQVTRTAQVVAAMSRPLLAPPKWYEYSPQFLSTTRIEGGVAFWRDNDGGACARRRRSSAFRPR